MDLRQALAGKKPTETHYDLRIADSDQAEQLLAKATQAVTLATLREDPAALRKAEREQAKAQTAVQACFYRLRFRNLPPDQFEALVSANEATPEQIAKGEAWNRAALTPLLLEACTVDSDLTAAEWEAELATNRWSAADKLAVYRRALDANVTQRSASVPFG